MLKQLLNLFTKEAYPLTLAYDPDGLLEVETVLTALMERGFTPVFEHDPIHLRYQIELLKPLSTKKPVIIRTELPLNELPFDLWLQGHHIQLSLHTFFPNLSYPVIQQLTTSQIWRLSEGQKSKNRLGQEGTIRYVLKEVFGLEVNQLGHVDYLLNWLSEFHHQNELMADIFLEFLIREINAKSDYASWPIPEIITNKNRFLEILQSLWGSYINEKTDNEIKETKTLYHVNFDESELLQTHLANIVQAGQLRPVKVTDFQGLPYWAKPGISENIENLDLRRYEQIEGTLTNQTLEVIKDYRWEDWRHLAYDWAEFTSLRFKPGLKLEKSQKTSFKHKQDEINSAFLPWLRDKYSYLAGRQLPIPHHLYHVPNYLAHERTKGTINQVALLVMDGMSLADWKVIQQKWRNRHKDWNIDEKLLLAQLPTITAISRQALISGLRPMEFAGSLKDNRQEQKLWSSFWEKQHIASSDIVYTRLSSNSESTLPSWIDQPRLQIACMVVNDLDDIMHHAMHGNRGFFSDLEIWLDSGSLYIEEVMEELLNQGFSIFVTSDHGHVEATGFGKITDEGLTVETRAKRARVYNNFNFASQNQEKRSPSLLWHGDNLLPEDIWALMPEKNQAYVSENEVVVAHGGATIEEVIVPFVKIEK